MPLLAIRPALAFAAAALVAAVSWAALSRPAPQALHVSSHAQMKASTFRSPPAEPAPDDHVRRVGRRRAELRDFVGQMRLGSMLRR
jgi:hypothetical protein